MILGAILGAIALGAMVYIAVKVTISFIKNYRKRKNSKIVAVDMKRLIKEQAKNPSVGRISFDDLEDMEDDIVLAEYDEEDDDIVQINNADDYDDKVDTLLRRNRGVVIIED